MARIEWNPLQQTPINIGLLETANQGLMGGIKSISDALIGVGNQYKAENTNQALQQVLGIGSLDDLATQRTAIADAVAAQGSSIDSLKVLEALGTQQDALARREAANIQLQGNQLALEQNQRNIADIPLKGQIYNLLLGGKNDEAANLMGQLKGDPSDLFAALRGEQRYDAEQLYKQEQDKIQLEQWNKNYQLQQDANTRANVATGITTSQYLNPNAGQTTSQLVFNPETNSFDYVTETAPSAAETLGKVLPLFTGQSVGGNLSGVRGVRNNNPGNLNYVGQAGARLEDGPNGRFAQFDTPQAGMNALSKQLDRYYTGKTTGKPLQTVTDIISAWAPPEDNNDTARYIAQISKTLGVGPNDKLNFKDPNVKMNLMKAIVTKENGGNPYGDDLYANAVGLKSNPQVPKKTQQQAGKVSQALGGIPIDAKKFATIQQEYIKGIESITKGVDLPESPLANKETIDSWLLTNRKATKSILGSDADDIYKEAMKEPTFVKSPTSKKIKVLNQLMSFNENNEGFFGRNADVKSKVKNILLEDAKVTKQVNEAKRAELLKGSATKIIASLGLPPNAISPEALYPALDPSWAKKQNLGKNTIENPFQ